MLGYILADIKGSSCIYFVGSYRSNEVPRDHAIFRFMNDLESCNVRLNKVHLDGMEIDDVNHIISDALGLFPRICKPLSQLVVRKTEGNPLFVLECLRSFVDRDLLQYSFRERRWVWDTDRIGAEDTADNVCELLTTKMIGLSEDTQLALKIASCFGTTISSTVISTLMAAASKFASFEQELEKAVHDGFMNKDGKGSSYRFCHDKVREGELNHLALLCFACTSRIFFSEIPICIFSCLLQSGVRPHRRRRTEAIPSPHRHAALLCHAGTKY